MSTTRKITHIADGVADGVIRIHVEGADDTEGRRMARDMACKVHGGIRIGKTPKAAKAKRGHVYDFTPVTVTRAEAAPAEAAPADALSAVLASLDPAVAAVIRAAMGADTGKGTGKGKGKGKGDARPVPPMIAERRARVASATCKTCEDLGVVRKAGDRAGQAYKTPKGAEAATASGWAVPCPSCKGKRKAS